MFLTQFHHLMTQLLFLIGLWIPLLAVFGYTQFLSSIHRLSFVRGFFLAVSLFGVLMFIFSLMGYPAQAAWFILTTGCLLFGAYLFRMPVEWRAMRRYALLYGWIQIFAVSLKFHSIDDYSFWGLISKYLYVFSALPVNDAMISPQFLRYVPGMAAFHQLWFHALGHYSIYLSYLAQDIILLAALMVRWDEREPEASTIYIAMAFILVSIGFGSFWARLEVDAALALYFIAISWILIKDQNFNFPAVFFPILFLSLIKEIGFLLAVFLLFLAAIKASRKDFLKIAFVFLALFLLKSIWVRHGDLLGFHSFASAINLDTALAALNPWNPSYQIAQKLFINAIFWDRFGHVLTWPNLMTYLIGLYFLWSLLKIPESRLNYKPKRIFAFLFIFLLLYLIILYLLEAIVFQVGQGVDHLLDFPRYYHILLIPTLVLILYLYIDAQGVFKKSSTMTHHTMRIMIFVLAAWLIIGKIERNHQYFMKEWLYPMVDELHDLLPKKRNWTLCLRSPPLPDYLIRLPLQYFFLPQLIQPEEKSKHCDYIMVWHQGNILNFTVQE